MLHLIAVIRAFTLIHIVSHLFCNRIAHAYAHIKFVVIVFGFAFEWSILADSEIKLNMDMDTNPMRSRKVPGVGNIVKKQLKNWKNKIILLPYHAIVITLCLFIIWFSQSVSVILLLFNDGLINSSKWTATYLLLLVFLRFSSVSFSIT